MTYCIYIGIILECTGEEYKVRTSGSLNKETRHVLVSLGSGSTKTSKGHNNG